jgi:TolA-binding protein
MRKTIFVVLLLSSLLTIVKASENENQKQIICEMVKIGDFYLQKGCYEMSIRIFTKLLKNYPDNPLIPYILLRMGEAYQGNHKYQEAFKYWEEIIQEYPHSNEAPLALQSEIQALIDLKRYDDAIIKIKEFIENYPKNEKTPYIAFLMGSCYESKGDLEKAIEAYKSFVKQFPYHPLVDNALQKIERIAFLIATAPSSRSETLNQIKKITDIITDILYIYIYFQEK